MKKLIIVAVILGILALYLGITSEKADVKKSVLKIEKSLNKKSYKKIKENKDLNKSMEIKNKL